MNLSWDVLFQSIDPSVSSEPHIIAIVFIIGFHSKTPNAIISKRLDYSHMVIRPQILGLWDQSPSKHAAYIFIGLSLHLLIVGGEGIHIFIIYYKAFKEHGMPCYIV